MGEKIRKSRRNRISDHPELLAVVIAVELKRDREALQRCPLANSQSTKFPRILGVVDDDALPRNSRASSRDSADASGARIGESHGIVDGVVQFRGAIYSLFLFVEKVLRVMIMEGLARN